MKKILFFIFLFLVLISTAKALELKIYWTDDSPPADFYHFSTFDNSNIIVTLIDKLSSAYNSWKRVEISQAYDNWNNGYDSYLTIWTWVLVSQLYWDFYLKYWKIELVNDINVNSNCNNVSYSFSWSLYSPWFWKLDINKNNSYYCPKSWKSKLVLQSALLWYIEINWTEVVKNYSIENSRWKILTITQNQIFDDKKISVNWINNIKNWLWLLSNYSEANWKTLNTLNSIKTIFNRNVNKNLFKYTKWKLAITNEYNLNSLDHNKKIFYYNYEWQRATTYSNKENKWKILTLWNWATHSDSVLKVYWQQLLYLKWWNLYINTDISNSDNNSLLVIVVKRDSTNKKNWWNVYINPNVTNIDAVIIADWSIIDYDWNNILNTSINPNALRKQLLIYWSVFTKNSYWKDIATYWTDDYISNWWELVNNIKTYNLSRLRSFQVMLNNDVTWDCSTPLNEIVAKWNTWTWITQYAFAWKKKCFIDWVTYNWLRSTEKVTPLVIEYNPIIEKNPHFILKK